MTTTPPPDLSFERSARRDLRYWTLLVVGAVFAVASLLVEPAANCDAGGMCAPWLVPVGLAVGSLAVIAAGYALVRNVRSGSTIDPATGEFVWWQGRAAGRRGTVEGRIDPARLARLVIARGADDDRLEAHDVDGQRLAGLDAEVVSAPLDEWGRRAQARWPHVEVVDGRRR